MDTTTKTNLIDTLQPLDHTDIVEQRHSAQKINVSKQLRLLIILGLIAIIPLTILLAKSSQDIRNRASEPTDLLPTISPAVTTLTNVSTCNPNEPTTCPAGEFCVNTFESTASAYICKPSVHCQSDNECAANFYCKIPTRPSLPPCTGSRCPQLMPAIGTCLPKPTPTNTITCVASGCNCLDPARRYIVAPSCDTSLSLSCLRQARCEKQANDQCGWTKTNEYQQCESSQNEIRLSDLNHDNIVDLSDYALLVSNFLKSGDNPADINSDKIVDLSDYAILVKNFLKPVSQN